MAGEIAIFLRNGPHSSATIRYALKVEDFSIQVAKTPVQIPVTRNDPELIDIGFYRPSITMSGIVDDIGGNPSETADPYYGMSKISVTSRDRGGATAASTHDYYIPFKNKLDVLTNCPDGKFHIWKFVDDDLVCQKCNQKKGANLLKDSDLKLLKVPAAPSNNQLMRVRIKS